MSGLRTVTTAAFESVEKLISQMDEDSLKARRILADMASSGDPMADHALG